MTQKIIVGVMGGGTASARDLDDAYELGALIARQGWVLLNGGRAAGIMDASAKGASENGGLTLGILPGDTHAGASGHIHIPVLTGMGNARNCINVLTSHVVVACPGGTGTISEIALALKTGRPVILLNFDIGQNIPGNPFHPHLEQGRLKAAQTPGEVIAIIKAHGPAW